MAVVALARRFRRATGGMEEKAEEVRRVEEGKSEEEEELKKGVG